jgi:sugar-specific transcriptional regulator TrmB
LSQDIAKQLLDFGLSDKESNIYLVLLKNGKARAGEIARRLQLNRMIVYRILTKLQERELVKATMERPMKFIPVPIDKALDLLIKETESKLTVMKGRYDTVLDRWSNVMSEPPGTDVLSFKIVQGRRQIYELLLKMFGSAEKWIRLVTTKKDLVRFQYVGLDDALKKASKRGVKVQIVVQYEDDKLDIIPHYVNFASVKTVSISKATRLFVADDREMIITFTTDDSMTLNTKQETCLKIQSTEGKSLDTVVDIFSNFWDSIEEFEITPTTNMTEDVKMLRTDGAFDSALKLMIESAKSELLIVIPCGTPASIRDKVLTELSGRSNQVYTRIILHVDQECWNKWGNLLQSVDAYHSDVMRAMQFIIKDKQEALVTLRLNSKKEIRLKHVWSNSNLYVESMSELQADIARTCVAIDERRNELTKKKLGEECLSDLRSILEHNGWMVKVPGHINQDGTDVEFGLIAQSRDGETLAADFTLGGEDKNRECLSTITSLYGKAMTCGADVTCLICLPSPAVEDVTLADYLGVRIVGAENREELSAKLSSIYGNYAQTRVVVQNRRAST